MKVLTERMAALSPHKQEMLLHRLRQRAGQHNMTDPLLAHVSTDGWILHYKQNTQACLRLFCFAYAGGAASLFRPWSEALLPEVEICCIQLPGREQRLVETPYTRMGPLVQALAEAIYPYLDRPFAFFGHSMGALVSFELARQLRREYDRHPVRLYIAAHRAPHIPNPDTTIYHLSVEKFKEVLRSGGTPEQILQNDEVMQVLMPTLRADFEVCGTYEYRDEWPLAYPFSIIGGLKDTRVSTASLEAWREQSSSVCSLRMVPGSHFFLRSAQDLLLAAISQDLGFQSNAEPPKSEEHSSLSPRHFWRESGISC
jgi:medium-chain acyl-[acyl-carrier-protein] hydrolase